MEVCLFFTVSILVISEVVNYLFLQKNQIVFGEVLKLGNNCKMVRIISFQVGLQVFSIYKW